MKNNNSNDDNWVVRFKGKLKTAAVHEESGNIVFRIPADAIVELSDEAGMFTIRTTGRKLKALDFVR